MIIIIMIVYEAMIRMIIIEVILTMIVIVTGEIEESKNVKKIIFLLVITMVILTNKLLALQ